MYHSINIDSVLAIRIIVEIVIHVQGSEHVIERIQQFRTPTDAFTFHSPISSSLESPVKLGSVKYNSTDMNKFTISH